jgi:outer membrane protein
MCFSELVILAQNPKMLTLTEAHNIALNNHPQIDSVKLRAQAASQVPTEFRSALLPSVSTSMTVAGAEENSRIAAGGLNNPIILSRYSNGISMSQLITDFGRISNLVKSADLHARAEGQKIETTKADVLLLVDQAYFAALRAQSLLQVAQETVKARQLVLDQITALANSKLKSSLDVSFAKVNLSESQLLLLKAQNDVKATFADLSVALGYRDSQEFLLSEEPLPPDPPADVDSLVDKAIRNRPELLTLRLERDSALKFAKAEHRLNMPTITMIGSAGYTPFHVSNLSNHYTAAGLNISIPIFTGHLYSARQAEADLKVQASEKYIQEIENHVARDVKLAWLNANTAFKRLDLTAELLNQAVLALDLAKTRYDLGLSSIVELNQAQLNKTEAEIAHSRAKYEYQSQYSLLQYQLGDLH